MPTSPRTRRSTAPPRIPAPHTHFVYRWKLAHIAAGALGAALLLAPGSPVPTAHASTGGHGWIAIGESPIPTPSLTPTESPTPSVSPTESPTPSPSPTDSPTPTPSPTPNPDEPPVAPREFRASWIATVANIDFPTAKGISTEAAKAEIIDLLDKTVATRMNAVVFQVRTQCDALYDTPLEPWSEWLTATMGTAPSPLFDPLAFTIEEGHKRGIEVHAWFNPYRALHSVATRPAHSSHITQARPDLVRTYGENMWCDPGEPEVPQITLGVMMDVVERYDVDGIHIDDYFYPYPISGTPFPDDESHQKYLDGGGELTNRGEWRRDNVNRLVHAIYTETKSRKPWVKVGISPFGIWRPGNPSGITGLDSYTQIYADSKLWLNEGWVDYFTPQLYWRIASSGQDYTKLLPWWVSQNTHGRHIWPGNYLAGVAGSWPVSEIVNQVTFTRTTGATGNVFFSIKYIDNNTKSVQTTLANGVYAAPALVPASPWLGVAPPAAPQLAFADGRTTTSATLTWTPAPGDSNPARRWVIYRKVGTTWTFDVVEGTVASRGFTNLAPGGTTTVIAISGLDANWNEGPRAILKVE